ncbi:MAG: hypothetical protein AMXMBFR7_00450 [Planctomycetota bacterium]
MTQSHERSSLIAALASRRPGLDVYEQQWRLVEDVLAGRLKRRATPLPGSLEAFGAAAPGWSSAYLPQGTLESDAEYAKRVELTPFFPETPRIMAGRVGALMGRPTQVSGISDPKWSAFLAAAGRRGSFDDLLMQAACLVQTYGFCAALLDREPLPADARGREASVAEAEARQLGCPYLTLYGAPDVLDWDYADDGQLAWVKLVEREWSRPAWDAAPVETYVYRIADRTAIRVFRVWRAGQGEWRVRAEAAAAHGLGRVPVALAHPFPGADGIGRPLLARAAEADIAATRVLSDLVWDLFVLGNPILTFKTHRGEEELQRIGVGASRYIPLRNGRPGIEEPEALEFVQLDATGLEFLFRAHALFAAQVSRQAGLAAHEAAATPREQSGVAHAWSFKTGEERHLALLARALERFFDESLLMAAIALELPGTPKVDLPDRFEVEAPAEALEVAERAVPLAREAGRADLADAALLRLGQALGGNKE